MDQAEFQINEQRYGDQSAGVVAALDAGKFAAVWVDSAASGKTTGSDIEMRVLLNAAPNAAPVVNEVDAITVVDTATQDTLPNTAGTLSATDPDTDAIASFGIQSGTAGGSTSIDGVVYDVSKAGTYGTLYVVSTGVNQGKYVFVPNSAAVDALLSGSATDTFTVTATDSNARAATGSTTLTVNVTGANDAPTNIFLSGNTVAENSGSGALRSVGTLTTADVDMGDSFTYSFAGGADDSLFQIVGNELRFQDTTTLDFEAKSSYSITLKTTDADGLTFDKTLSVLLTNVNEAPVVAVPLAAQSAAAGLSYSYTVPAGSFTDPDSGQTNTLVYSAALADNGALPSWLHFDPATRTFSGTPTSEDVGTPSVRVTATDGDGLSAYSDFTLSVVNGPSVNSIVRADSATALTNASSLTFTITFSESVIGVTNDDFIITGSATGGSVGTPSSSDGGVKWTVQVTGAGDGTVRLDLKSSGTGIQSANNSAAIVSGYTAGASYLVDRTPPATPVINTAALTNQALPTLSGTAETNATVTVVVGGATYTTTATGGAWSINLASANPHAGVLALNANGSNWVSVMATDAAGNPSTSPATQMLVIDTTPPAAPAVTSPALTSQGFPTLAGTAEVGATITVVVGTGSATYTTVADGSGAWSVDLDTAMPTSGTLVLNSDGTNSVTVIAKDAANNPSQGTLHTLTIDTTPPAQTFSPPQFSNDKGSSDTDFITNTPAQVISATLSAGLGNGDIVQGSLDDGVTWTDITTKVNGTELIWDEVTLTGSGTLKIKVTDAAGNDGTVLSQVYVLDTVAPAIEAGTVSLDGDSGSSATDFITNNGSNQTLRGTLTGNLSADEIVEVSLDNGSTWTTATALVGTSDWSLSGVTFAANGTLQVRVSDTAGNSSTALSQAYAVDTAAPVFDPATSSPGDDATGVGISSAVVLRFGEPLASVDAAKVYLRDVATQTLVAAAVTLNADGALVITPNAKLASLTDYYISWDADALKDVAGNAVAVVDNATTFNFKTELITPPTPVDPAPPTGPVVVDGVAVTTVTQADGSTRISIPIVQNDRQESVGAGSTADITLVKSANGQPILSVGVPTGVGITAEGFATPQSTSAALADLGLRLEQVDGASNQLINDGNRFFASLDPTAKLVVQLLTLSIPGTAAPGEPIRVTGSTAANVLEAVIVDARGLPAGTVLQVDDIDFVAIVGAVRVIGGAGRNSASGDGAAQYIVLGADDDIIHGGGGNDTVGSKGGDDQIYGDAGNDTVFGGAGNDLLSGGSGSDKLNGGTGFDVALQEGKRSDYSITLDGTGIKLTHIATSVADWLVDVEQVRFETGPILTVAHSAAEEAAAFLFQQWMGRDLTQSEGAVIQTLDGLSALQVADLFAQVFPQQAGGKTAQQLLEGMETAGAIRVDVARDTTFVGDAGNNTFTPPMGLAWTVDGGAGIDTIVIPATLAQMHVEASATGHTLQRMTDGAMLELVNVERVTLSDTQLALDLDGHAGEAAKLIGAVGGVALLDNKPLVGEVIRALDAGVSAQSLAQLGLQLLGANTPGQVTQLLWTNVVGSAPTPAQLQPFIDMMAQGVTGGELAVLASNLELNAVRIDLVGLAATGIEFA
ncbi:Ig-like domain-containing protein [Acidovorax sp. CCYZU-2555]|uniref:putative Ig domain-containing protein n=1 Tax=Acidovorax sp. CCYZU-2555 TaxID=2835042 RepID=UPI0032DEF31F